MKTSLLSTWPPWSLLGVFQRPGSVYSALSSKSFKIAPGDQLLVYEMLWWMKKIVSFHQYLRYCYKGGAIVFDIPSAIILA